MEVTFEHQGGQSIELGDLSVTMTGTDTTGTPRNYSSDELSAGMVDVDMVIYHEPETPDLGRTVFELGDVLKVTFTFENESYLFDVSEDAVVSLIYTPANQILVKSKDLVAGPRVVVDISPPSQVGERNETLDYTVTITNNQGTPDTFALTASNDHGWSISIPGSVSVSGGGASEYVTLQVTIPGDATSSSTTTVTAVSQSDPDVSASDNCVTRVRVIETINPVDEGSAWHEKPDFSITNPENPSNDIWYHYFTSYVLPGPELWLSEVGNPSPPGSYQRRVFLKFTLPDMGTEMTVEDTTFRFYFGAWWIEEEPDTTYIYACSDTWNGSTLTWNNSPAYGSQLASVTELGSPPRWVEWQGAALTSWVRTQDSTDDTVSFMIKGEHGPWVWDGAETIWRAAGTYNPGWGDKPELVVTYLSDPPE